MDPARWTRVVTHATVATCVPGDVPYGLLEDGAVACEGAHIAWVGPSAQLPPPGPRAAVVDARGALLTPGLVDCHTHLVFAGHRAREFEQRLQGASYEQIARAGGGILSTVQATRAASLEELAAGATARARTLLAEGVTTLEVKSGYGLDLDNELKLLRAARRVAEELPVTVHATLLAAHAVPPEYAGRADEYVSLVAGQVLPAAVAEGLADSVDAFCECIAFTPEQVRRIFESARAAGLPVRLHAEQLSNSHGSALAAGFGALSADHLEWLDEPGAAAMAAAGTVAVLLPAAFYFLRETRLPPVGLLRRLGVPIALASDFNPGSAPLLSLRLAMNMGCVLFGLTAEEALAGVTRHAARALGMPDRGEVRAGQRADLVLWEARHPAELSAQFGTARPRAVFCGGQPAA